MLANLEVNPGIFGHFTFVISLVGALFAATYYAVMVADKCHLLPFWEAASGPQWADEPQIPLNLPELLQAPWTGEEWTEVKFRGDTTVKAKLRFSYDEGVPKVIIRDLPNGPIELRLKTQGVGGHSYKAEAKCLEHGGQINGVPATMILWEDNRVEVIVTFVSKHLAPIDRVFRSPGTSTVGADRQEGTRSG